MDLEEIKFWFSTTLATVTAGKVVTGFLENRD